MFEVFRTGVEILIFFLAIYATLRFLEGTRGAGILYGMLAGIGGMFLLLTLLEKVLQSQRLQSLKEPFVSLLAIFVLIIFQPELRRALIRLGQNPFFQSFTRTKMKVADELVKATAWLSATRTGALIALERNVAMNAYAEAGNAVELDAALSAELLCTIFSKGTKLHDGAVIVQGDRVAAAACIFPLSDNQDLPHELGTRHRAAIGVTEETDAVVIVVSEETGRVSLAQQGQIQMDLSLEELRKALQEAYAAIGKTEPGDKPEAAQA